MEASKWGEPSESHMHQMHHDYLRAHYNDTPEGIANPSLHDHFYPLSHHNPDGPSSQMQARHCPGWEPDKCTSTFTQQKMKGIGQQTWDVEHDHLLDPAAHEKRQREQQHAADSFLSDYKLDHPDRVHKWNEDGSLGPSSDPRLGSKTASDWHAFDTNRHYRRGHQDGAQGVYDQDHDTLSAKVDMGIPLEPHEVDYMAGHAAGTQRAREHAQAQHDMKRVWEEHGQPYGKTSAVLTDWKPTERLFSPTKETVDPRLFDVGSRTMKPAVRQAILDSIDAHWAQHQDWRTWAKVYLAGSEASLWWGNNDFDLLIGVDYDAFRKANPKFAQFSNKELTDGFNRGFAASFNNEEWHPPFDRKGIWHRTGYVNMNSYDIRKIKPYAAYDVTTDSWAVEPVSEPTGHQFSASEFYYAEGIAEQIKNILRLQEPERTQQAIRLWKFLHADRSRAFGPSGSGLYDRGNMVEKYLDQAGLWAQLVNLRFGKTATKESDAQVEGAKRRAPNGGARGPAAGQGSQIGVAPDDNQRGAEEAPEGLTPYVQHNKVAKDLAKLDKPSHAKVMDVIDTLHRDGRHGTTEPFQSVKGWDKSKAARGIIVVHSRQEGVLHIGYVGNQHNYDEAARRLGGRWESEHDLKRKMDAEKMLRSHVAAEHPDLDGSKGHAVLDMHHRLLHGTVGPQQQLDMTPHQHDPLISPTQPFSVRHPQTKMVQSAIKLECQKCGQDYFTDGEAHACTAKEARVKTAPGPDGDDSKAGIMVAIAPPARIVENLVLPEGEHADNLHITIAYLGDVDEHSEAQIDMLPELVAAWAEGQPKLDAKVQGVGTFVNEGNHVLWASADIPGVNEMHVSLVQYLTGHGFDVRKDHSFTPHITLAYGTSHFRFMPKIEPTSWKVREVWCCIGGRWESFPLRGR